MNKTIFRSLLAVSLIAILLMAGCQKDYTTLRVRIDNFGGNSKVYMGSVGNSNICNIPMWSQLSGYYDTIWIDHGYNADHSYILDEFNTRQGVDYAIITVPNYTSYCAIYPFGLGSVSGTTATLNIPQEQRYYEKGDKQVVNAPMAACTQNDPNGSITFHNLGALLAINIECNIGSSMDVMEVIVQSHSENGSPLPLWGTTEGVNLLSADAFYQCSATTPASTDDPTHSTIYLRKYGLVNNQEVQVKLFTLADGGRKTVYVYVPAVPDGINNYYSITVNGTEGISMTRTQESHTGGNLVRNMMVNVPFSMQDVVAPDGAIDGKFTINANGDQVYFAQGNLQWRPTTTMGAARSTAAPGDQGHWRIAKNQYDFIGNGSDAVNVIESSRTIYYNNVLCNNESISDDSYSGWIDLFGWATSGWNNTGNDSTSSRYHPYDYDKSTNSSWGCWNSTSSNPNRFRYGPNTHYPTTAKAAYLQAENENYDWGVYNNDVIYYVDANDQPQPTTNAQWRTLTYDEWKYIFDTRPIEGDNRYSRTVYRSVPGFVLYPDDYIGQAVGSSVTNIPSGCVFLPIAGFRDGAVVTVNSNYGYYWSSQSGNSTNGAAYQKANSFSLQYSNGTGVLASKERYLGYAVRLVTPVQ